MGIAVATPPGDSSKRKRLWQAVGIFVAAAYAAPLAWNAYGNLMRVNEQARARLIQQHRLWEMEADFRGRPENWIRFASRLLNDQQLLRRVAMKYGAQSEEIEREYRRDLTIARAEVIVIAISLWATPLAGVYGVVWLIRRRRPHPPPKSEPASASDPRYRPPA